MEVCVCVCVCFHFYLYSVEWLVHALVPVHPTDIFVSQNRFRFIRGTQPIKHTHRKQKLQNRNNLSSAPGRIRICVSIYYLLYHIGSRHFFNFVYLFTTKHASQPISASEKGNVTYASYTKLHDISSLHHVLQDRPFRWKERASAAAAVWFLMFILIKCL